MVGPSCSLLHSPVDLAFETGLDEWLQHHGLRIPNEFVCHAL